MFSNQKKPEEEPQPHLEQQYEDEVLVGKVDRIRYMGDKPIRLSFRLTSQDKKTSKFHTVLPGRSPTASCLVDGDYITMTVTTMHDLWPWPLVISCEIADGQTEKEASPLPVQKRVTPIGEAIG